MEIKPINEQNCASIVEKHLENTETFVCMITSSHCKNCKETTKNIEKLLKKYPTTKVHFYTGNYATDDLFSEYYQMAEMIEFPKIIIFHGSKDKLSFLEGVISFEHFEEIHQNASF